MVENAVKERPILFKGDMVRALLAGEKTQTRRVVGVLPKSRVAWCGSDGLWRWGLESQFPSPEDYEICLRCPFGEPGDRLWVRESFALSVRDPEGPPPQDDPSNWDVVYRTAGDSGQWHRNIPRPGGGFDRVPIKAPWRPSIHMPRWAARIVLEVTDVRVERVQSIADEDILAEGIAEYCRSNGLDPDRTHPRAAWIDLWDKINSRREGGLYAWDSNPWTWAISFRRIFPAEVS